MGGKCPYGRRNLNDMIPRSVVLGGDLLLPLLWHTFGWLGVGRSISMEYHGFCVGNDYQSNENSRRCQVYTLGRL